MFEWYVVICGFDTIHQKDMCRKEIGSRAQIYILIIQGSIVNMIGGDRCHHLMSTRIFNLIIKYDIYMSFKNHKETDYDLNLDS